MNFGGLIALQKQQKKETQDNKTSSTPAGDEKSGPKKDGPSGSKTGNGDTSQKQTEGSGDGEKKDKKSKSKLASKPNNEESNGVAGYMKDNSKINQDIENIKSRGKNAKTTKSNLLSINDDNK